MQFVSFGKCMEKRREGESLMVLTTWKRAGDEKQKLHKDLRNA
jgi:hypothetical protein